jgi:hypothetical protein
VALLVLMVALEEMDTALLLILKLAVVAEQALLVQMVLKLTTQVEMAVTAVLYLELHMVAAEGALVEPGEPLQEAALAALEVEQASLLH